MSHCSKSRRVGIEQGRSQATNGSDFWALDDDMLKYVTAEDAVVLR